MASIAVKKLPFTRKEIWLLMQKAQSYYYYFYCLEVLYYLCLNFCLKRKCKLPIYYWWVWGEHYSRASIIKEWGQLWLVWLIIFKEVDWKYQLMNKTMNFYNTIHIKRVKLNWHLQWLWVVLEWKMELMWISTSEKT